MKNGKKRYRKNKNKFAKILFLIILLTTIYLLYPKALNNKNIGLLANFNESIKQENQLIVVNDENKLPSDYNVKLVNFKNNLVADILLNDLKNMYSYAAKDNITLYINNAYRSIEDQQTIFDNRVQKYKKMGYDEKQSITLTKSEVKESGYSEHHTGLAIDFSKDYTVNEQMWNWLENNAYKYGFILRYPQDKIDVTKITYERWHYRYVGIDAAKIMYENNLCLEEYLNMI